MNIWEWLSNSAKVNEFILMADQAAYKDMQVLGHGITNLIHLH